MAGARGAPLAGDVRAGAPCEQLPVRSTVPESCQSGPGVAVLLYRIPEDLISYSLRSMAYHNTTHGICMSPLRAEYE